jgi:Zn-dependent protease with chaperone function
MVLVTAMMVLMPLIYLAMIAAAAWGTYWYARHCTFLLRWHGGIGRLYLVQMALYIAPLFTGAVLVLFMVKPLFARRGPRAQPLALNPALEPTLYAFIARICELVGAPMPSRIDLVCDLNASVSFRRGAASLLGNDLVLTIGLPLVAGLNLREFAGVIAHEFGHFTQVFGMRLGYIINHINIWFLRLVYQRDALDLWLDELGGGVDSGSVMLIVTVARLGVWFSRTLLKIPMFLGFGVSCFLMRQGEYHADACAIRVAGGEAVESLLRRLCALGDSMRRAYKEIRATWNLSRKLPDDFPRFLVLQEARTPPAVRQRLQDTLGLNRTGLFDVHPSEGDRIRAARRAGDPGVFHLEQPASILFSHFDVVAKQITHLHYAEDHGLVFGAGNLRPVQEIDAARPAQAESVPAPRGSSQTPRLPRS